MHFKIIVPFYNVEKWILNCIRSVKLQDYKNFQCILVDDISTDNTVSIIEKEIANDDRFVLIKNKDKCFALENIYNAIKFSNPKDEDVIVTLDGDDWFASKKTLDILYANYQNFDCWMTYGSYVEYPTKNIGKFSKQIPQFVVDNNSFRKHEWCSSHLRTFKYKLWKKIDKADLLDENNKFYKMAWDLSFMFPMLEMAGDKSKYINDILYVYNLDNPLNDHKTDNRLQISLENKIRNKTSYNPLIKKEKIKLSSLNLAKNIQTNSYNKWIAENGEYTHRINYELNENSTVVDWGGFVGDWAQQIYDKYNCHVHVYEAFEQYANLLKNKFISNKKIKVYDFGVAATTKKVNMIEDGLATKVVENSNGDILLVSCEEIMKSFNFIDLLKINIEGLEYEVLTKIIETDNIKKIKNIQVQFHAFDDNCMEKYDELKQKLEKTHVLTYNYPFIWENWSLIHDSKLF